VNKRDDMELTSNPRWAFAARKRTIENALDAPGGDPEARAYAGATPTRSDGYVVRYRGEEVGFD
jgi:hypothetical protein